MKQKNNRFLQLVDNSYFQYFCIFGAVSDFQKRYPDEASLWIKPVDECDQENLPNILNSDTFKRILKQYVMKRLETIENIAKQNFQDQIDSVEQIDIVFACDDKLKKNFRLDIYPQYKANRLIIKRQYKLSPIKEYMYNILYKELGLEDTLGYKFITVEGAEGDDIIATALLKLKDNYLDTMLIASDHDFLQINGVREFDLFGKESKCELGGEAVTADDYLLGKILMGDRSDNIKQVFAKCGPKTALKYVKNKDTLNTLLAENQEYADRFLLNKKIISFSEIPTELSDKIERTLNEVLYKNDIINPASDLKNFMIL